MNSREINSNTFQISANEFIKDLYLYDQNQNVILDDNYFDLDFGKIKLVKVIQSQNKMCLYLSIYNPFKQ